MNESESALVFYLSVLAIVTGTIRFLRASIERNVRDVLGMSVALAGVAGLIVAIATFLAGPRRMLPF